MVIRSQNGVIVVHIISADKLKLLLSKVFQKLGVPKDDSEIVADSLVTANLRCVDSHGLSRGLNFIEGIKCGDINPRPNIRIVKEGDIYTLFDGDKGIGVLVAYKAVLKAIEKAKARGIGISAARNIWDVGSLAYYVSKIVKEGFIGIAIANARARMTIPGIKSAMVGTNPVAIAIPTGNEPIILDMALSVAAYGKIILAARRGMKIPEGWALDSEGKPTTDPREAMKGYLLPIGSYKGLGLAIIVDILSGIAIGAPYGLKITVKAPYTQGGFVTAAFDIGMFRDPEEFIRDINEYIRALKSLPKDPDVEILMPGEPEARCYKERSAKGIPIDDETWEQFTKILNELKIDIENI